MSQMWLYAAATAGFVAALPIAYYTARYFWEMIPQRLEFPLSAVFISGCDSGFGQLLAIKCARAGFSVYAGCLTTKGAERLIEETKLLAGEVLTVPLDITNDNSVQDAQRFVVADLEKTPGKKLWALVNNAGVFNIHGPDQWCTIEEYKRAVDVNTFGTIRCTHAFLPQLKASRGRIITVTSVAGRVAVPFSAPYCVAKFGCEAYMDVIRMELADYGVTCCIIEPGLFRTDLLNEERMHERTEKAWAPLPDEIKAEYGVEFKKKFLNMWNTFMMSKSSTRLHYVVDAYFHAIIARYPRLRYRCGFDANFLYIPLSFVPTAIADYLMCNFVPKKDRPVPIFLKNSEKRKLK